MKNLNTVPLLYEVTINLMIDVLIVLFAFFLISFVLLPVHLARSMAAFPSFISTFLLLLFTLFRLAQADGFLPSTLIGDLRYKQTT
jgi:hypothetical protein